MFTYFYSLQVKNAKCFTNIFYIYNLYACSNHCCIQNQRTTYDCYRKVSEFAPKVKIVSCQWWCMFTSFDSFCHQSKTNRIYSLTTHSNKPEKQLFFFLFMLKLIRIAVNQYNRLETRQMTNFQPLNHKIIGVNFNCCLVPQTDVRHSSNGTQQRIDKINTKKSKNLCQRNVKSHFQTYT